MKGTRNIVRKQKTGRPVGSGTKGTVVNNVRMPIDMSTKLRRMADAQVSNRNNLVVRLILSHPDYISAK